MEGLRGHKMQSWMSCTSMPMQRSLDIMGSQSTRVANMEQENKRAKAVASVRKHKKQKPVCRAVGKLLHKCSDTKTEQHQNQQTCFTDIAVLSALLSPLQRNDCSMHAHQACSNVAS